MPDNEEENSYSAALEKSRLEESLRDEEPTEVGSEKQGASKSLFGRITSGAEKAGRKFDAAAKAVASGQYAVWQAMWDLLAPTFGLSLFLIYVPIFSWIFKKTFPKSVSDKLPEPGEDGLLGFVPPPDPATAKFVMPFYGIVNKIVMLSLASILTLILLLLFLIIIIPPLLMIEATRSMLGPVGEALSWIFGGS